jgi:hypothetical protein
LNGFFYSLDGLQALNDELLGIQMASNKQPVAGETNPKIMEVEISR